MAAREITIQRHELAFNFDPEKLLARQLGVTNDPELDRVRYHEQMATAVKDGLVVSVDSVDVRVFGTEFFRLTRFCYGASSKLRIRIVGDDARLAAEHLAEQFLRQQGMKNAERLVATFEKQGFLELPPGQSLHPNELAPALTAPRGEKL